MAIGIRFPFQETFEGGVFRYTKTTPEAIRTNLISLLTTKKRQRVMRNDFYSPLYDQIFELWDEIAEDSLRTSLNEKISKYIPEITVEQIIFIYNESNNVLTTKIAYSINTISGVSDAVEIDVNMDSNLA